MIASDIVTQGYREGNIIPVGTSPSAGELAEGLSALNSLVDALFGFELGEQLYEWPVPPPQRTASVAARYPLAPGACDLPATVWPYPPCNTRLMASNTTATTVYFPEKPNDGARMGLVNIGMSATLTLDANGRKIETALTKAMTFGATTTHKWLYRSDTGNWVALVALIAADASPLPSEFDNLLICGLNIRLSPRHGKTASSETVATYNSQLQKLKARYRQPTRQVSTGDVPNTTQTYGDRLDLWS